MITYSSTIGTTMKRTTSKRQHRLCTGYGSGAPGRGAARSGEGGERGSATHAGQPVQADDLDQPPDLRLGVAQQHPPPGDAQAAREHREVEHQRGVGERELAEVDDDVGRRPPSARESAAAGSPASRCPRRRSSAGPRAVREGDDAEEPTQMRSRKLQPVAH